MKKLFISLVSLGILFIPFQSTQAGFWDDLGDSVLGGAGIGVDTNNDGTQDVEDSINNWADGIGQDIVTDLFGNTGVGPIPDGQFTLPCPEVFNGIAQTTSIRQYVLNIVKWVLGFLGLLAVIMIIYGGLLYVTDGGEGSNVEKAKKILLYSIIGILIVFAAYPIVNSLISIASTGDEPVAGQPLYVASNQNSSISLSEACELQQNANLRPWFSWDWQDSNIQVVRSNIIKIPLGTPVTLKIKESDLGAGTYTPEVNFVYWNFGNGSDWTVSTPQDQLSITKTFFEAGKYYVSAVVEDDKGARHRLLTQVIVGNVLEAEFTASTYFPASGQVVQFDATPSMAYFGGISEYEWTVSTSSGTGTCPDLPDNSPIVSATFYGDDLDCLVTLTIFSDVLDDSGASFGSSNYQEIIEVSLDPTDNPEGAIPTPEMNYVHVLVDPNDTGEDHLVSVKVEGWDSIAEPLDNYKFEVFESGTLISSKVSNFGVNVTNTDDRPAGVDNIPADKKGSFSETIFDLSPYKGTHEYLFRATVTNGFGRTDSIDSEPVDMIISNGNTAPTAIIYVDPEIGDTETEFAFRAHIEDIDGDDLSYRWIFPDGISTNIELAPNTGEIELLDQTFNTSGNKIMTLWVSDGVDDREITKSVFVGNGVVNVAPEIILVAPLPGTTAPIGTLFSFYPQVVDVNGDSLTYVWNFNNEGTVETKNAAFQFAEAGIKEVIFTVSDGEEETERIINLQVYDPANSSNIGQDEPQIYIDRIIINPEIGRAGETEFDLNVEFKDINGFAITDDSNFTYQWNLGDGSNLLSTETIENYMYQESGLYNGSLLVNTQGGGIRNKPFAIQVVGPNEEIPNRAPAILSTTVFPRSYGTIEDTFRISLNVVDPEQDEIAYIWKVNGNPTNRTGSIEEFEFNENGYQEIEITATDTAGKSTSVQKVIYISDLGTLPENPINEGEFDSIPEIKYIVKEPGVVGRVQEEFIFTPTVTDDGDVLNYQWDFGDGAISEEESGVHVYENAGNYVVRLQVSDESNNVTQTAFALQVIGANATMPNRAPIVKSVTVLPKSYGKPNEPFTFLVDGYDPDENDSVEYVWKTDSGQIVTGNQVSISFEKDGYNVVVLTASDGNLDTTFTKTVYINNNGEAGPSAQVVIANRTPQIVRIINTPGEYVRIGEENKFSANIIDEKLETISYVWKLGDGTTATESSVNHVYSSAGQYLVELEVLDEQGAIATKKTSVRVFGPEEEMPNRVPVIKQVEVLPARHGKPDTEFTFKSLIADPDGDEISIEWKTIEGVFGSEAITEKTFTEIGYKTVYLEASDGQTKANQLINIYISNEGVSFAEAPNGWQSQYLELLALIADLESQEATLSQDRDNLLEQIINEEDETVRADLMAQLQLIISEIENIQDNKTDAEQSLEEIKSENTEGQSVGLLNTDNENQVETNKQITLLENLITQGESIALETLQSLGSIERKYLDLWKQFIVTDDPVERSRIKELLQIELQKLHEAKEKNIRAVSEQEALRKELDFLEMSLKTPVNISRVEQQRAIQKLRRIIKQLSHRRNSIEEELQSISLSQQELLEQISIEGDESVRKELQTKFENQQEKENSLYDELLSTKKSIAGMESESTQKEAELYVSSIQTKEAINGKIKKLEQDVIRIEDSLSLFSENLLVKKLERTTLEGSLIKANTATERQEVSRAVATLTEKITNIKKGISTQERKIQYFKRAIDRLKTQALNITGSGYAVGIKNKEELQQKLENTEVQIQDSKGTITALKTAREVLESNRNVFLAELEAEISETEKSIILEKIKILDIELFDLDKKIVSKESAFEILNRTQISLKKDLFGSVSAADLKSSINELEKEKQEVVIFQNKFIAKLKDKKVKRHALLEQIQEQVELERFQILARELENLEVYETNVEQFGLVFELGTAIQHKSFPSDTLDFSTAEELIRSDKESVITKLMETLSEEDQAIFLPLYTTLSVEIYNLEKRVLEQSDTIDLIELKKELLQSAMADEKVVFEEKINEKIKKIASLKDSIETLFDSRLELEKDWKVAREKLMNDSNKKDLIIKDLENIDSEIVKKDTEITEIKAELFSLIVEIDAYYELLDKYFVIKGTVNTKFFLYGRLPNDSAQALFIEWHTGDGRVLYGQNAIIEYNLPGRYVVKMNVTDGVNTSTDSIVIRVENK